MKNFFDSINRQINGFIINLVIGALLLMFFAVLVVWSDFVLQIVVGCALLVASWVAFYTAYKLWQIKRKVKEFLPKFK